MKTNIHPIERLARIGLGTLLVAYTALGDGSPWFLLGIIPLMTGLVGWCPPYAVFGINTCNRRSHPTH